MSICANYKGKTIRRKFVAVHESASHPTSVRVRFESLKPAEFVPFSQIAKINHAEKIIWISTWLAEKRNYKGDIE